MDLAALRTELLARGSPLTLAATDTTLPPALTAFLATAPERSLSIAPASGGIALSGSVLTVAGTTSAVWPVQGLAGVHLTVTTVELRIADGTPPVVGLTATGTLPLGGQAAPVAVTSPIAAGGGWTIALTADVPAVTPEALVGLAYALETPFAVPEQLDVLSRPLTLARDALAIAFVPGTTDDALLTFAIEAPQARFALVDGVAELEGLTLRATIKTRSISLTVIGHVEIDGIDVDVGVGFSTGSVWTAFIAPPPGKSFPGIVALADWIAGSGTSQAGDVKDGFANVGFDTGAFDAAIEGVSVAFDVSAGSLVSFEVFSRLTVAAIPLDLVLTLPELTVSGTLHPGTPVRISDVLGALHLPTGDLPLDAEIGLVILSAQPSTSSYALELHVDDVAQAGPFSVEQVSLLVSYSSNGFDGQFGAEMSVWDLGALEAVAEYSSTGGWTWSAMTPPGQDLELGAIIAKIGSEFGLQASDVPEPIRTLDLKALTVTYASGTSSFAFTFTGDFAVADVPVEIAPSILVAAIDPKDLSKGYRYDFGGTLTVAFLELALAFDTTPSSTTFVAALAADTDGKPGTVDIGALVSELSPTLGAEVPSGIAIDLKSAKLASIAPAAGPRTLAFALDLAASIGLSELPLVGDRLPPGETVSIDDLQVLYASAVVTAEQATQLNAHLPPAIQFPAAGLAAGPGFSATATIAGTPERLSLGLVAPRQPPQPPQLPSAGPLPATRPVGAPTAPAGPAAPTSKWFDIQRKIGTVQFSRIGVVYDSGTLFLAIDAALTIGPLTLSVDGLGVGSTLTRFEPTFTFTGAGLEVDRPPLRIGGAFLRVVPPPTGTTFELDGSLVIEAEGFGIAAVGSYAVLESGAPSLFAFGQLSAPLGGPPAFFVTGLMAGFGVNRALTVPEPTEVEGFPLLVLNEPPAPGRSAPPQGLGHVLDVIEGRVPATPAGKPRAWISPAPGEYWFAAGLTATHFELVQTRAVVVVELGKQLQFALLGLATMALPQAADSSATYAYAELELEAVLEPSEGRFGLTALLTPSSYVLVPQCKLTGGFAFQVWFGDNPHAGQFVLTLGGYHPAFRVPDFYPAVPRLGFSWAVSSTVSISGGAYFALTPSSAMAGGRLQALFSDGDLKAWFTANADLLVSWRPFSFTAGIDVEIGVSYRLNLLICHKTIELSLGASVDLWGPPTGGRVHVHLWCVSFTVRFGSHGAGSSQDPLEWTGFRSLLPATDAVVSFQPTGGLAKQQDSTASTSGKAWIVRATAFSFTTESAVPASHLCIGAAVPGDPTAGTVSTSDPVDVKPMNRAGLTAVHRLVVRRGAPDAEPWDLTGWTHAPRLRNVPDALWGTPPSPFAQTPAAARADVVPGRPVGFAVAPPPPAIGATRGAFPLAEVAQETIATTAMPLDPGATPGTAYLPADAPHSVGDIARIAGLAGTRTALVQALGALYGGADDPMTAIGAQAATLFADAPMEVTAPA